MLYYIILYCSTSIVRRNMRRLDAEGVRLEKFQRNLIDWGSRHGGVTAPGTQMNQLGLRGRSCRASSI